MDKVLVVSGYWRCGTSLTMQIIKALDIQIYYNLEDEKLSKELGKTWSNANFFEDGYIASNGLDQNTYTRLIGKCVKVFDYGWKNMNNDVKKNILLIRCIRPKKDIIKSLQKIDWTIYKEKIVSNPDYFDGSTCFRSLDECIEYVIETLDFNGIKSAYSTFDMNFLELIHKPKKTITNLIKWLKCHKFIKNPTKTNISKAYSIIKKKRKMIKKNVFYMTYFSP